MKAIQCAGLGWNDACPKQAQCSNYAKWWEVDGVQLNACGDTKVLKHFIPVSTPATALKISQQELFA